MPALANLYPGHPIVNFFIVVAASVALIAAAAWVVSLFLERHPAVRHCVLLSALAASLASPLLASAFIASGTSFIAVPLPGAVESLVPRSEVRDREMPLEDRPPLNAPENSLPARAPVPKVAWPSTGSFNAAVNTAEVVLAASDDSSAEITETDPFRSVLATAFLVWLCGTVVFIAGLSRSSLFLRRLRRSLEPHCDAKLGGAISEARRLMGARAVPTVMVSRLARTPMAAGLFHPVIVLPAGLTGVISHEQLCDVLIHEVAHIERRDNLIVLLQAIAKALYWPVPFVHLLNRQLARAREDVCDNRVLACRDAVNYGETLLRLAQLAGGVAVPAGTAGILHWRGKLEKRIVGLIQKGRSRTTRTHPLIAIGISASFILASALLCAITILPARAAGQNEVAAMREPGSASDPDDPKFAAYFSGRVSGPDGEPLSGARIFVVPLDDAINGVAPVRAVTDADGGFAFDAPDMTYTDLDGLPTRRVCLLSATADGYAPDWIDRWGRIRAVTYRKPVAGTGLDLQLATDAVAIRGRFLDANGQPLAGAHVRLTALMIPWQRDLDAHLDRETKDHSALVTDPNYERRLHQPHLLPGLTTETRTGADGRFTLSGLGRDRLAELRVSAPGVVDTRLTVMTRDAPDVGVRPVNGEATQVIHGAQFTLQLKRGLTISGVVRDRDSGEPIPGMWVGMLGDSPLNGLKTGEYSRAADAKGRFTITGLNPRLLELDDARREVTAVSPPGLPYQTASVAIEREAEVLIETARGIPFRLKLADEQGRSVEAEVTYIDVQPNPHVARTLVESKWPISRAARKPDGTYEGFVLPGPGAVLVKLPGRLYRPAHADPKAFFAPGRTDWTAQERRSAYGTEDTLATSNAWINQHDYNAIVLVNPSNDSGPLELSATVVRDRPRRVTLIDPEGHPVVGVRTQGMTYHPWDHEPPLRAASFSLTGLHPNRIRHITFIHEDRRLIGFLMAQGDGESPYTVRLNSWGTVTGRLVDENGDALENAGMMISGDPEMGASIGVKTDAEGRFRIDKLIPGHRYSARISRDLRLKGTAFEPLVLRAGEIRDLGEIRLKPSVDTESGTEPGN